MADYWAKIYIEIIDDPKMATLPDRLWRRIIELFLLAKKFNNGGHLPDTKQIAWMLRMSTDDLDLDMKQISSTKIVIQTETGWFIPNFEKRQAAATNTERVQQFRKRQQKEQYYDSVTEMKRIVTQSTETETETETEAEGDGFSFIQKTIEQLTGYPPNGSKGSDAIQEILNMGAIEEDIKSGIEWMNKNGINTRYYNALVNPIRTAMSIRLNPKVVNKKNKLISDLKFDNV